jgi:phosphatidylinositol glycan class T
MTWPQEERFSYRMSPFPPFDVVYAKRDLALDMSPLSDLSVLRTLKGSSQTHGELAVVLRNNRPVTSRIHYLETMPWHVEFFLHTLRVSCGDGVKCSM